MINWKPIAGFLAGLLTGSAITYIFTKSKMQSEHAKELNEIRANAMQNAMAVVKDRGNMTRCTMGIEKTEDGNVKNDSSETDISITDFKEREVEDYVDYAKQYAPETSPSSVKIEVGKSDKKIETKPVEAVSLTDDHSMSMIPYFIDPDDYGEKEGYECVELTYYSDGIIAYDDNNDILEKYDFDETIGNDFKEGFGEYSDTCVWIRNNKTKIDYVIEKSPEPFYGAD